MIEVKSDTTNNNWSKVLLHRFRCFLEYLTIINRRGLDSQRFVEFRVTKYLIIRNFELFQVLHCLLGNPSHTLSQICFCWHELWIIKQLSLPFAKVHRVFNLKYCLFI